MRLLSPRGRVFVRQVLPTADTSCKGVECVQHPEELPGRVPQRERIFGRTDHTDFSRHRCGLCISTILALGGQSWWQQWQLGLLEVVSAAPSMLWVCSALRVLPMVVEGSKGQDVEEQQKAAHRDSHDATC